MRRGGRLLLFVVLIVVILGAVGFLLLGGGGLGASQATPTPPLVTIVIAGQPIQRDDEIVPEALSSIPFPQDKLTSQMITNPNEIVGLFAQYPLAQGIPITRDMLSDRPGLLQPGSEAARVIPPGLTAISIPLSRLSSVAYAIRDGDRVNVIVTTNFLDVDSNFQTALPNFTAVVTGTGFLPESLPTLTTTVSSGGPGSTQGRAEIDPTLGQAFYIVPSEVQRPRLVSQMLLQDIQVLHVGNFILPDAEPQQGQLPTPTPTPSAGGQVTVTSGPAPDIITLIVTPQDAVTLTYLMYSGARLNFTLRAPDDPSRVETEAATLQYLLSQYAIPVPAKLPYATNAVDTINPQRGIYEPNLRNDLFISPNQ